MFDVRCSLAMRIFRRFQPNEIRCRKFYSSRCDRSAFTLIELLVVIAIIIILIGFLFPAFRGAQDQAKRTQAKNDLTQIVTAVNAFYTEYGKYPVADADQGTEKTFSTTNRQLIDILRSLPGNDPAPSDPTTNKYNLRKIVFIQPPDVKDDIVGKRRSGVSPADGNYYDPWSGIYSVRIDSDYNNQVANPYTQNAGATPLQTGVIAWSLGKDVQGGSGDKKSATSDDDVISWQ
jgi:prepilin-type N-terminal cleavage/methylation domain-containing protein